MKGKNPQNIILDSSVIAKWFFPTEVDGQIALSIKDLFLAKEISISVPTLIYYEINNLIRTAIKGQRVSEDLAKKAYQGFLNLDLVVYSSKGLMESALEIALLLDISSYDASYVALSQYLKIPFLTSDQKLLDKSKSDLVLSLKEFEISSN